MNQERKPRRDDEFELVVEGLEARGGAVGRWGEYSVHLRHGLPGQRLRVQVQRRRRQRIEARVLEELEPAPDAVEPRCAHFTSCGGCSFQDLGYPAQLAELQRLLERLLAPLGAPPIEPLIAAQQPWAYRNKMDFTFSNRRWIESGEPEGVADDFALGLHVAGRHDKVLDVARCDIMFAEGNAILAGLRRLARAAGLTPWDSKEHRGLLRHAVLRRGHHGGQIMVYLVTSEEAPELVEPLVRELVAAHPEITTVVQGIHDRPASIAVGERERVLHGPGFIREELGGLGYSISPTSFFQTNTTQAERLLELIAEEARLTGDEVVYDLYCGTGAIALRLARSARVLWGFELVEAAVEDARRNARDNGIENAHFVAGDLAHTILDGSERPAPLVCVVDPPRAGVHPRVIGALRTLAPQRLVYVSCNPASAARDLPPLLEDGYALIRVRPIDLFPHTPHLECVLTLERRLP